MKIFVILLFFILPIPSFSIESPWIFNPPDFINSIPDESVSKRNSKSKLPPSDSHEFSIASNRKNIIDDDPNADPSNPASNQAMNLLDIPYRWGGLNIDKGLDCSGFVFQAYKTTFGITLPRTSAEMARQLPPAPPNRLWPGDLVFFNTRGSPFSHVGVYLGGRLFAHSPRTGAKTRIENIMSSYWISRFNGARRPLNAQQLKHFSHVNVQVSPPDFDGQLYTPEQIERSQAFVNEP